MKFIVTAENRTQAGKWTACGADGVLVNAPDSCYSAYTPVTKEETDAWKAEGISVTVRMDRLYGPDGIEEAKRRLGEYLESGYDAVIADIGLLRHACAMNKADRIIFRPETLAVSSQDVQWWTEQGIGTVSVSPLLTEEETVRILKNCPECELTVHGHTILSVSGRPLLSLYGKHADLTGELRDRKDLYITEETRSGRMPVYETAYGTAVYSDYILDSLNCFVKFVRCGVQRCVFETAFLEDAYICDTIRLYDALRKGRNIGTDLAEYRMKYQDLAAEEGYYHDGTVR